MKPDPRQPQSDATGLKPASIALWLGGGAVVWLVLQRLIGLSGAL